MDDDGPVPHYNLLLLLEMAYKKLDAALVEGLQAAGFSDLRPAHSQVFRAIGPAGSRVGEMAAQAGLTQQSMSELVDGLERLGYVERRPDAHDRRAKIIVFTERGRECVRVGIATVDELERGWSTRIGDQAATAMRAGLECIVMSDADHAPT